MSSFLIKTCLKFHKCSRLTTIWYTWNYPSWGGADQVHTPKKLKFQIWPSSLSDKCNLILWWKLSFLWKSEPDPTHLRGVLSWFSCWWYPRYMHSQYMYFELGMYFLMNTLLIFSFSGFPLSPKIWFTASLLPYWSKYEQILRHPPEGELQASWGLYTTPVVTAILDVILKPMQSDLVGYRLFLAKFQNYRPTFTTHLGWFTCILHHFNSNIRVK